MSTPTGDVIHNFFTVTLPSVPQESRLASIIGSRPELLMEWESFKANPVSSAPAEWHTGFWGTRIADEQKSCDAQPPVSMEGSGLGNEGRDGNEITESEGVSLDDDDDLIPGCDFLYSDIETFPYRKIWIRAEYIRIYDAIEAWYDEPSILPMAPAMVITGQPGIGEFWFPFI